MNAPIFLKPLLVDGGCFKQQVDDIENYFRPAFDMANLTFPEQEQSGIPVSDNGITSHLVERVFRADLVIVDANPYPTDPLNSPWLYYCIGLSHSFHNHTILVGRSLGHLPVSLRKQHALSYDTDRPAVFFKSFSQVIKSILVGESHEPDNPIQEYLLRQKLETELQKLKMEAQARDAQLKELQQRSVNEPKAPQTIKFRKVG